MSKKNKINDTLNIDKQYDELIKNVKNHYNIYMKKVGLLLILDIIDGVVGIFYIYKNYKNIAPLIFIIVSLFSFLFLEKITTDYRNERNADNNNYLQIKSKIPKNKRDNYPYPKVSHKIYNGKIFLFYKKINDKIKFNISISVYFIVFSYLAILLCPIIFDKNVIISLIFNIIALIINVYITSQVKERKYIIKSVIFIIIFLLVINVVVAFNGFVTSVLNINTAIEICNSIYTALGLGFMYLKAVDVK